MKKPKIRFQGYTEDWEQCKVFELAADTCGGGTPKPKKFITEEAIGKSAAKLVAENSIAIVTRVGVGKLAIMPFSYATSQDFLSLSRLYSDLKFTAYLLYKKMQSELNAVQGTSIKGITREEFLNKEIMLPKLAEQKKIGEYFSALDHIITLHQRKVEKLRSVKKFMLKNMFV